MLSVAQEEDSTETASDNHTTSCTKGAETAASETTPTPESKGAETAALAAERTQPAPHTEGADTAASETTPTPGGASEGEEGVSVSRQLERIDTSIAWLERVIESLAEFKVKQSQLHYSSGITRSKVL